MFSCLFSFVCIVFMCVFFVLYIEYFPYCLFVSNSQVIGCEDRLRNDLYCVGWGVKLYSINHVKFRNFYDIQMNSWVICLHFWFFRLQKLINHKSCIFISSDSTTTILWVWCLLTWKNVTWWFALSTAELPDGINPLQDSKSDVAFCDPFKGLIYSPFTDVC